jgi:hypothetical protein
MHYAFSLRSTCQSLCSEQQWYYELLEHTGCSPPMTIFNRCRAHSTTHQVNFKWQVLLVIKRVLTPQTISRAEMKQRFPSVRVLSIILKNVPVDETAHRLYGQSYTIISEMAASCLTTEKIWLVHAASRKIKCRVSPMH